ncbi:MAG: DNA mismatch repair protein MutS [Clostridiales bacterium]|nr:DNA mismatch repair protein MutS [Clostridiales bacterium]
MAQLTPMMQQYVDIKKDYKDCILFYRLGDFYEMFFEDAIIASKELEITLTGKSCGLEERAPMAGVPYHSAETYINKLIKKGYRVAICEQVEDPKEAKGIVKREVVRIVTPGTNFNPTSLDETKNNYLMCIVHTTNAYGVSIVDISTGDFYVTELDSDSKLMDEINKFVPTEIISNSTLAVSGFPIDELTNRMNIALSYLESRFFDEEACYRALKEQFRVASLNGLGLEDFTIGTVAAGSLLQYLYETQKTSLSHLTRITPYLSNKYMILDSSTRRNLELVETMREKQKRGSLLWVLDKTKTAMGARLLRSYVEQPLINKKEINSRLDGIEELNNNVTIREEIREYLNPIYDLERLIGRISYKSANPRDLIAFKTSLGMIPHIKYLIGQLKSTLWKEVDKNMDTLEDIWDLIDRGIIDDPPILVREGGIIKEGFSDEVDRLRKAKTEGKTWIAELEAKQRDLTGIKNLKVKYNKVFGYFLEVTNANMDLVPEDWVRKQTLANSERYTIPELKELEDIILNAEDKLFNLEYELFTQIRDKIADEVSRIQQTAKAIAITDVFTSLAAVAERNNFVRPNINEEGYLDIKDGRHPVVEKMISNDMFVANDTYLDDNNNRISIITGPNMSGKSTYMRQVALIVLMAQIGSFVPASYADIGIVDRIFTRVGASDDLASGQSTFMVEMTEVANILNNATKNSLLILDEIGRGTSTFDGLSIAWAVVEYINNSKTLGAKTLFATHYHELTELEGKLSSVNNYCIAVKEQGDDIVFLRKIIKGGANRSYGIQVASLAGVPNSVIKRANEISELLSMNDITEKVKNIDVQGANVIEEDDLLDKNSSGSKSKTRKVNHLTEGQMSIFDYHGNDDIINEIKEIDLNVLTPIEAMNILYKLQEKAKNR